MVKYSQAMRQKLFQGLLGLTILMLENNFISSVWNLETSGDTISITRFSKIFHSVDLQISMDYSLERDLGRGNKTIHIGTSAELN